MKSLNVALTLGLMCLAASADPLKFEKQCFPDSTYEAASIFDVDKDGNLDVVSGEYWRPGPDFKEKVFITELMKVEDYYDNFSDYPMDVNGDGYMDLVGGGWFGKTMFWMENPKGQKTPWTVHKVAEVGNVERNVFYDIDGDGFVEVFSTNAPVNFFRLIRDKDGKGTGEFKRYTIMEGGGGHGFGCGDLNGDKRADMVFADGWMEAPADPYDTKAWKWHPDFKFGMASVPILVHDVNEDGKNDIIVGQGHDYGLAWHEQGAAGEWIKHDIETDRSQFHVIDFADIDNDGAVELVTGKRWRAHLENDPGAADPIGLYYYEINKGNFERVTLDYGPADKACGSGIYFWVDDIDKNGWKDILAPGKQGMCLFKNMGDK